MPQTARSAPLVLIVQLSVLLPLPAVPVPSSLKLVASHALLVSSVPTPVWIPFLAPLVPIPLVTPLLALLATLVTSAIRFPLLLLPPEQNVLSVLTALPEPLLPLCALLATMVPSLALDLPPLHASAALLATSAPLVLPETKVKRLALKVTTVLPKHAARFLAPVDLTPVLSVP